MSTRWVPIEDESTSTRADTARPTTVRVQVDGPTTDLTSDVGHDRIKSNPLGFAKAARSRTLDAARGLAVLLMVLDHVLVQVAPGHWLRATLTRAALPLFCVVSGMLLRQRRRLLHRRWWAVVGVGVLITPVSYVIGLGQPDVLIVFAIALVLGQHLVGKLGESEMWALLWLPFLFVLDVQVAARMPAEYTGYRPSYLAALILCGVALRQYMEAREAVVPDRGPAWLASVGRNPLAWYAGHVVAIYGVLVGLSHVGRGIG